MSDFSQLKPASKAQDNSSRDNVLQSPIPVGVRTVFEQTHELLTRKLELVREKNQFFRDHISDGPKTTKR